MNLDKNKIIFVSASPLEYLGEETIDGISIHHIGIGKINSAHNITRLIHTLNPTTIINFGSCGNLKNHKVGDVLEVGVVHNDIDCRPFADYGVTPEIGVGSIKLSDSGIELFTTDSVYDNSRNDYSQKYLEMINKCNIVDMECYSLAYICNGMGINFKSFKWVSDDGDVSNWEKNASIGYTNFKKHIKSYING